MSPWLTDPTTWILAAFALLQIGLFAGGVVSRRHLPLWALLVVGVPFGAAAVLAGMTHVRLQDVFYALIGIGVAWLWMAVPGVWAAVGQPGQPAPMSPGRAARHLGLALAGAMVSTWLQPDLVCFGAPMALVAVGSTRSGERVERAWAVSASVLACTAALWAGLVLGQVTYEDAAMELVPGGWAAISALAVALELRLLPRVSLLVLLSALFALGLGVTRPLYTAEREAHRLAAGRELPDCDGQPFNWLLPGLSIGTLQSPPEAGGLFVAGTGEDVGPLLSAPFRVACVHQGVGYRFWSVDVGMGVDILPPATLADGEPLDEDSLARAVAACGLSSPSVQPRPTERWPLGQMLEACALGVCVVGEMRCTWSPERGWHVQ